MASARSLVRRPHDANTGAGNWGADSPTELVGSPDAGVGCGGVMFGLVGSGDDCPADWPGEADGYAIAAFRAGAGCAGVACRSLLHNCTS